MEIGRRVAELREEIGATQAELAERLGMDVANYQRIEHGRTNLTLRTLVRLAEALEVEPREILAPPSRGRQRRGRPRKTVD